MTGRRPVTLGLAAAMIGAALGAGAQPAPRPRPVDPHDRHDQRSQPTPPQPPQPQHQHHHGPGATPAAPATGGPQHGQPAGWKFSLPKGDPARGREVFVKLECYACHEVKGQTFPGARDAATLGPELSGMAAHHDPEFFAEAIVNPGAVIDEPRWRAPDGTSKMPSFNDSMSVQELVDLVAFLKSLSP